MYVPRLPAAVRAGFIYPVKPTALPLSRVLGLKEAPAGAPHLLELALGETTRNHLGTMHAAAQFALAEAASAAALQRDFPDWEHQVVAVVRGARLKYRRPGTGPLRAFAGMDADARARLVQDLGERTRAAATVGVELRGTDGAVAFAGEFDWFFSRRSEQP